MIEEETLLLLAEMDLAWPERGVPATDEDAVRIWTAWLRPYELEHCRQALRKFGGVQVRPPSLAQVLGECRAITGDVLPEADEVLAEFRKVVRQHSSRGVIDPTWFSCPEIGAFAVSGAFEEWGNGTDPAYDPERSAAASAQAASMRRRWDGFAARVERGGLRMACERLLLEPAQIDEICGSTTAQIGEGS